MSSADTFVSQNTKIAEKSLKKDGILGELLRWENGKIIIGMDEHWETERRLVGKG